MGPGPEEALSWRDGGVFLEALMEEERAFEVRDRRAFLIDDTAETAVESKISTSKTAPPEPASAPSSPAVGADEPEPSLDAAPPEASFASLIFSLATSALHCLGEGEQAGAVSLPEARRVIDLLAILQEKTRGNLTPDEEGLLANILYTLRMRFIEVERQNPSRS